MVRRRPSERAGFSKLRGLIAHPMYPVPKILWLREHRPELYSKPPLSERDGFHPLKLGLPPYIGYSLASRFLAFDVNKNEWSDEIWRCRINSRAASAAGSRRNHCRAGSVRKPRRAQEYRRNSGGRWRPRSGVRRIGRRRDRIRARFGFLGTYECLVAASDEPKLSEKSFAARLNSYSHVVPGKFLTLAYFPSGIMVQLVSRAALWADLATARFKERGE